MPVTNARLHESAINRLVNDPGGPIGKDLRHRAGRVERRAKQLVHVRTGALRQSIGTRYLTSTRGPVAIVGSRLSYALLHHNGTRRHRISASPGRVLRFRAGGRVVLVQHVNHPGTRPNPYLLRALREAA